MRLGSKGRYAVMAMADLARHGDGEAVCLAEIAERQEISLAYLEQLFARLRRAGLVKSVRGPGGGYRLTRSADAISVAAVVQAVDEPLQATRCDSHSDVGCLSKGDRCATHHLWAALGEEIEHFLGGVSLADVVGRRIPRRARGAAGAAPADVAASLSADAAVEVAA
jgi:Rrf2 family transcriptional regulator, iron-sulfur cluster assembly transcription factor